MAVEEAKKASRDERTFMQTALTQHKAAKAKQAEERRKQKHLEKRMKAILKLKENIASSEVRRWWEKTGVKGGSKRTGG